MNKILIKWFFKNKGDGLQKLWEAAELGLEAEAMLQIFQATGMQKTSQTVLLGTDCVACPKDTTNTELCCRDHSHYCLREPDYLLPLQPPLATRTDSAQSLLLLRASLGWGSSNGKALVTCSYPSYNRAWESENPAFSGLQGKVCLIRVILQT